MAKAIVQDDEVECREERKVASRKKDRCSCAVPFIRFKYNSISSITWKMCQHLIYIESIEWSRHSIDTHAPSLAQKYAILSSISVRLNLLYRKYCVLTGTQSDSLPTFFALCCDSTNNIFHFRALPISTNFTHTRTQRLKMLLFSRANNGYTRK